MIYFDTDVIINYLVEQNPEKNLQAIKLFFESSKAGTFFCSLLCLQESAFVLSKLKVPDNEIERMMNTLNTVQTFNYNSKQYTRAIELCKKIGFQNINDCLHVAIAEDYCNELVTYNSADFKKIQQYTNLKITIL